MEMALLISGACLCAMAVLTCAAVMYCWWWSTRIYMKLFEDMARLVKFSGGKAAPNPASFGEAQQELLRRIKQRAAEGRSELERQQREDELLSSVKED